MRKGTELSRSFAESRGRVGGRRSPRERKNLSEKCTVLLTVSFLQHPDQLQAQGGRQDVPVLLIISGNSSTV